MSGFAGLVFFGEAAPADQLGRPLDAGLTGSGFSAPPQLLRTRTASFAYRHRPAIAGEPTGAPLAIDGSGGPVSLFDGRLDTALPFPAARGDGERVALAYQRWGPAAVDRLLGDFAWALWDPHEQRLLLARDHSIQRALFYYHGPGWVAFATSYRALFAVPGVPRVLDEDHIVDLLATTPGTHARTLYRDICWVRPAELVTITPTGLDRQRFWQPERRPRAAPIPEAELLDEARSLFDQAVACRDRSAGPPVVSLSGGFDSAAVAATLALRHGASVVHGLTRVPADDVAEPAGGAWYRDERPLVAALAARHTNLQVEYLTGTEVDPWDDDPTTLFLATDGPLRAPANAAWLHPLLRRAGELGAPVVLGGGFGNMTYSAHGFSRLGELLASGLGLGFPGEFLALRRHVDRTTWLGVGRRALGARLPWLRALLHRHAGRDWATDWRRRTALNPSFAEDAAFKARFLDNAVTELQAGGADGRFRELNYVIERSLMQVESRATLRSATGIDLWDPYADRRIIDFCLALPEEQFLRHGQPRALARRVFADRLPARLLDNPRRGEQNADWALRLTKQRSRLERDLEQVERSALAGRLLDLPRLKRMLHAMPTDPDQLRRSGNEYKVLFSRAVHVGRFLAWYERVN